MRTLREGRGSSRRGARGGAGLQIASSSDGEGRGAPLRGRGATEGRGLRRAGSLPRMCAGLLPLPRDFTAMELLEAKKAVLRLIHATAPAHLPALLQWMRTTRKRAAPPRPAVGARCAVALEGAEVQNEEPSPGGRQGPLSARGRLERGPGPPRPPRPGRRRRARPQLFGSGSPGTRPTGRPTPRRRRAGGLAGTSVRPSVRPSVHRSRSLRAS